MKTTFSEIRFNYLVIRRLSDGGVIQAIPLTKEVKK